MNDTTTSTLTTSNETIESFVGQVVILSRGKVIIGDKQTLCKLPFFVPIIESADSNPPKGADAIYFKKLFKWLVAGKDTVENIGSAIADWRIKEWQQIDQEYTASETESLREPCEADYYATTLKIEFFQTKLQTWEELYNKQTSIDANETMWKINYCKRKLQMLNLIKSKIEAQRTNAPMALAEPVIPDSLRHLPIVCFDIFTDDCLKKIAREYNNIIDNVIITNANYSTLSELANLLFLKLGVMACGARNMWGNDARIFIIMEKLKVHFEQHVNELTHVVVHETTEDEFAAIIANDYLDLANGELQICSLAIQWIKNWATLNNLAECDTMLFAKFVQHVRISQLSELDVLLFQKMVCDQLNICDFNIKKFEAIFKCTFTDKCNVVDCATHKHVQMSKRSKRGYIPLESRLFNYGLHCVRPK